MTTTHTSTGTVGCRQDAKSGTSSVKEPSANEQLHVPLVGLASEMNSLRPEIDEALQRVLASQQFYDGAEGAALETAFAELEGAQHAIAVNSGTSAILLAA